MIEGWKYYNYAVVPTTAPHEEADISCIKSRTFWIKCGGGKDTIICTLDVRF